MTFVPKQQQKNEHVASLNLRHTALLIPAKCATRQRTGASYGHRREGSATPPLPPPARKALPSCVRSRPCACVNGPANKANNGQPHTSTRRQRGLRYTERPVHTMSPASDTCQHLFRLQIARRHWDEVCPQQQPQNEHVASLNLRHTALLIPAKWATRQRTRASNGHRREGSATPPLPPPARKALPSCVRSRPCACVNGPANKANNGQPHTSTRRQRGLRYTERPVHTMSPASDTCQHLFRLQIARRHWDEVCPQQQPQNEHVASLNLRHTALLIPAKWATRQRTRASNGHRRQGSATPPLPPPHAKRFCRAFALPCACVNCPAKQASNRQPHTSTRRQKGLRYTERPVRTMSPASDTCQHLFRLQQPRPSPG